MFTERRRRCSACHVTIGPENMTLTLRLSVMSDQTRRRTSVRCYRSLTQYGLHWKLDSGLYTIDIEIDQRCAGRDCHLQTQLRLGPDSGCC